ncbi:MAG TPA: FHA domain-containing protein [Thermoflexales bacterium]|nr:FHA domain-containing protein [Thermoflexales bacterium]HQW34298.1 FHA domain-containing protein [Thermoflexales bacterium]HQZ21788.1 FHA domain-containing protein [Thermoflexales bacterium]HQZ99207.1 FHA domain-containing protein [Thermoflexales bacterium]
MNHDSPMLVIENGQMAGQRWLIDSDRVVIGREVGAVDLLIVERQVSRRHAMIERTEQGFVLKDLSSKNGTFLNGKELREEPVLLQDGDEIQVALSVRIAFVGSNETAPLNARPISSGMKVAVRGVRLDKETRRVFIAEQELDPPLSAQQYRLLEMLVDANGSLVPRQEIVERVWEGENSYGVSEQAIDALVRRLRDRITERDPDHEYIVTVRGHGLRFENR